MKRLAILGCTGSIGTQTLDIVRSKSEEYKVVALSCNTDADNLIALAKEFNCKLIGISDVSKYNYVRSQMPECDVYTGNESLDALAACDADIVVVAVVGIIGLRAVVSALKCKKTVALANKESLVAGGALVKRLLKSGGEIRPVDSEHSAVWQCLRGEKDFKRIILTASGGPFWYEHGDLSNVTVERAVAHPNWKMGRKISVDSATMMNKGLEIIEARWLFDTTDIDYVIHPESVVHSMVEFADGSIKAQAGFADMRLPIQYALSFPEHAERVYTPLTLPLELKFFAPDEKRFPAPALAKQAILSGGNAAITLNAANEAAVRLFLEHKIKFTDIVKKVSDALSSEPIVDVGDIDDIFAAHKQVYDKIYF